MSETEIEEVLKLLRRGINRSDWDIVIEAVEFLEEFSSGDADEDV